MHAVRTLLVALALAVTSATPALAATNLLVTKQALKLPAFKFRDGQQLPLTIGYETYGHLNAKKDNAILVCHFFSGTSHVAGRYTAKDKLPGYWDYLVGPGRAVDTNKYFVVSADVPANVNVKDPRMTTTGPQSIDPQTRHPYGSRFPVETMADIVGTQHALMEQLGIARWHGVIGASLGGLQALQWAVSYPGAVERVVAIAAPGRMDPYNQDLAELMIDAIHLDPNWHGGDYYGGPAPTTGLAAAWKLLGTQTASRPGELAAMPDRAATAPWQIQDRVATKRVPLFDAGAWVTLSRASRDYDLGRGFGGYKKALARIQARVMLVAMQDDGLFPPPLIERDLVQPLTAAGHKPAFKVLPSKRGHVGAISDLAPLGPDLARFLAAPGAR